MIAWYAETSTLQFATQFATNKGIRRCKSSSSRAILDWMLNTFQQIIAAKANLSWDNLWLQMIKSHKVTKSNGWSKQCNANGLLFNPKRTLSLLRPLKTNNTSIIWNHLRLPRCCQERALTVTRSSDITSKLPIFELAIGCFFLMFFLGIPRWSSRFNIDIVQVPCNHRLFIKMSRKRSFLCLQSDFFTWNLIFFPGDSSWRSTGRWCAWWAWRYTCHLSSPFPGFPSAISMAYRLRGSCSLGFSCSFPSLNTETKHGVIAFPLWKHIHQRGRTVGRRQKKRKKSPNSAHSYQEILRYTHYIQYLKIYKGVSWCSS